MSNAIRIYKPVEIEFYKLNMFASLVNELLTEYDEKNDTNFSLKNDLSVQNLMFDAGQNWNYTGVVTTNHFERGILRETQALCPRDYEFLVNANSFDMINELAKVYIRYVVEGDIKTPLSRIVTEKHQEIQR